MKNLNNIPNFITLKISILQATNFKGTRVKITDLNLIGLKIILPYDYFYKNALDMAIDFVNAKNVKIYGLSECIDYYLLFVNHDNLKNLNL
jgi:hypothetical protein